MQVASALFGDLLSCFAFIAGQRSRIKSNLPPFLPFKAIWILLGRKSKVAIQDVTPSVFLSLLFGLLISSASHAGQTEVRIYYIFQGSSGVEVYDTPADQYAAKQSWVKQSEAGSATQTIFLDLFPVPESGTINGQYKEWQYHYQLATDGIVSPTIYTNGGPWISVECAKPFYMNTNNVFPDYKYWCEYTQPEPTTCVKTPYPILLSTGAKETAETDFIGSGASPLQFTRTYRSDRGGKWSHNHEIYGFNLAATINTDSSSAIPDRACIQGVGASSGKTFCFKYFNSGHPNDFGVLRGNDRMLPFGTTSDLSPAADINDQVIPIVDGGGATIAWQVQNAANDFTERYDLTGRIQTATSRNGLVQTYTYSDGTTGSNGGFILDANSNPTIDPLPIGLVIRVTDASARSLQFGYNAKKQMVLMLDPENQRYSYGYDANNNLTKVIYPDGHTKQYLYGEIAYTSGANLPNSLTGILDENGTRYATYRYDATGRAFDEDHGGSIDHYNLAYSTDSSGNPVSTTVTDPLGTPRTYNFTTVLGVVKSTGVGQPGGSGCGAAASALSYDANGNIASRTDFNGNTTTYAYDLSRNLETSRTEASGTALARTITTTWDTTYRLPTVITEPGRVTNFAYDSTTGNLLTKSITDTVTNTTRTSTYTYTTSADGTLAALLKTVDGPRTDVADVASYTYYPNGDLASVSNALGHLTSITSYDPNGRPLTIVDPNGLTTTLSYTPRGWLASRSVGTETTNYTYDGVGQLIQVTLPDSSSISYTYDAAHRLTDISDVLGNHIHSTLDNIGNRIQENTYDNLNNLSQTKSRSFDALNRLWKEIGALNQTTLYTYDPNGNLTSITDPLTHTTVNTYDALNRLAQVSDAASGITRYSYDPLDQLKSVTDPRNLVTSYSVNALGDQTQLTSPDTGSTNKTYDAAGNLKTSTDARGQVTTYSYDALNRVTLISFTSGTPISFQYDSGPNALGKLSQMNDEAGTTTWTYNSQGRISQRTQTEGSISQSLSYTYETNGHLSQVTYPSGRIIQYGYDAQGRINTINMNGQAVLSNVQYQPFGPAKSWTWGNNTNYNRSFDSDGRVASYPLGNNLRSLSFDSASRIYGITDSAPASNQLLSYDNLDRLTSWVTATSNQSYTFDANGNRTSLTIGANQYSYTLSASSNQLQTVAGPSPKTESYDSAGNLTSDGSHTFVYTSRGRLSQVTSGGSTVSYLINGLGQRIVKNGASPTYFLFDEGGHLTGEYDATDTPIEETVYLGDVPVAVLR